MSTGHANILVFQISEIFVILSNNKNYHRKGEKIQFIERNHKIDKHKSQDKLSINTSNNNSLILPLNILPNLIIVSRVHLISWKSSLRILFSIFRIVMILKYMFFVVNYMSARVLFCNQIFSRLKKSICILLL